MRKILFYIGAKPRQRRWIIGQKWLIRKANSLWHVQNKGGIAEQLFCLADVNVKIWKSHPLVDQKGVPHGGRDRAHAMTLTCNWRGPLSSLMGFHVLEYFVKKAAFEDRMISSKSHASGKCSLRRLWYDDIKITCWQSTVKLNQPIQDFPLPLPL